MIKVNKEIVNRLYVIDFKLTGLKFPSPKKEKKSERLLAVAE